MVLAGVKKIMLFVGVFVIFPGKSAGSKDCPANQEILSSCASLRSSMGFTYIVSSNIKIRKCEQGWYFQNGTFIVDSTPNASGKRLSIVVDVTPQNLTVSVCENLQWQLNCGMCYSINFTVTDVKHSHDLRDKQDGNAGLPLWVIALFWIVGAGAFIALSAILFCSFRKRKRADFAAVSQNMVM